MKKGDNVFLIKIAVIVFIIFSVIILLFVFISKEKIKSSFDINQIGNDKEWELGENVQPTSSINDEIAGGTAVLDLPTSEDEATSLAPPALLPMWGSSSFYLHGMVLPMQYGHSGINAPNVPVLFEFILTNHEDGSVCNPINENCEFLRNSILYDDGLHDDKESNDEVFGNHLPIDNQLPLGSYELKTKICQQPNCGSLTETVNRPVREIKIIKKIDGQCFELIPGRNNLNDPTMFNLIFVGVNMGTPQNPNLDGFLNRVHLYTAFDGDASKGTVLFNSQPFKDYIGKFNVWYINPMYFSASSNLNYLPEYMLSRCPFQRNYLVFIHSEYFRAFASYPQGLSAADRRNIPLSHEFGHDFGGLADEYSEKGRCDMLPVASVYMNIHPNIYGAPSDALNTMSACQENSNWQHLIGSCVDGNGKVVFNNCPFPDHEIMCFNGGNYCGPGSYYWRPAKATKMNEDGPFSVVDISALCRSFKDLFGQKIGICNDLCMNGCPNGFFCGKTCTDPRLCVNNGDGTFCNPKPCADDTDGDGICENKDNCQENSNILQEDFDLDGIGDVCDNDIDNDGSLNSNDCEDKDKYILPGQREICGDGFDNDCSGEDLACPTNCVDEDKDGYGANCPSGPDCVDSNAGDQGLTCPESPFECTIETASCAVCINIDGTEICDAKDNDCDGSTDENLQRACSETWGFGICRQGNEICTNGVYSGCATPIQETGLIEGSIPGVCSDKEDNDCDNIIDYCDCTISRAYWESSSVLDNSLVELKFDYSNCATDQVKFQIFKQKIFRSTDRVPYSDNEIALVAPIFKTTKFTAEKYLDCDADLLSCKSGQYYFTTERYYDEKTLNYFQYPITSAESGDLTILWECDSDGDLYLDAMCKDRSDLNLAFFKNTKYDCNENDPTTNPGAGNCPNIDDENPLPGEFIRGDSNGDFVLDMSDAIQTLNWLFSGGVKPKCMDGADANDDGVVDMSDAIFTLGFLFQGNPKQLPNPFPDFGLDQTGDNLQC